MEQDSAPPDREREDPVSIPQAITPAVPEHEEAWRRESRAREKRASDRTQAGREKDSATAKPSAGSSGRPRGGRRPKDVGEGEEQEESDQHRHHQHEVRNVAPPTSLWKQRLRRRDSRSETQSQLIKNVSQGIV